MAEAAGGQATPSFKLVLVGDGGTGKVRLLYHESSPIPAASLISRSSMEELSLLWPLELHPP